jgi:hypothetical protein
MKQRSLVRIFLFLFLLSSGPITYEKNDPIFYTKNVSVKPTNRTISELPRHTTNIATIT